MENENPIRQLQSSLDEAYGRFDIEDMPCFTGYDPEVKQALESSVNKLSSLAQMAVGSSNEDEAVALLDAIDGAVAFIEVDGVIKTNFVNILGVPTQVANRMMSKIGEMHEDGDLHVHGFLKYKFVTIGGAIDAKQGTLEGIEAVMEAFEAFKAKTEMRQSALMLSFQDMEGRFSFCAAELNPNGTFDQEAALRSLRKDLGALVDKSKGKVFAHLSWDDTIIMPNTLKRAMKLRKKYGYERTPF